MKSLNVQQSCIAMLAVLFALFVLPQSLFANGDYETPPPVECRNSDCGETEPPPPPPKECRNSDCGEDNNPEPEPEPTPEPTPVPPSDDDNDSPAPTPPDVLDCGMLYSSKPIASMNAKLTPLSETASNVINNEIELSVKRKMLTPNYLTVNIMDVASNAMIVEQDVCWQKSSTTDEMGRRMYTAKYSTTLTESAGKRNVVVLCDLKSANYVRTCAKAFKAPDVMAN